MEAFNPIVEVLMQVEVGLLPSFEIWDSYRSLRAFWMPDVKTWLCRTCLTASVLYCHHVLTSNLFASASEFHSGIYLKKSRWNVNRNSVPRYYVDCSPTR